MGLYDRYVVPWLLNCACSAKPIAYQRAKVVPDARGRVLELGMGSGLNLPYYDADKVEALAAVEPSEPLRRRAELAVSGSKIPIHIQEGRAEALPYENGAFDCVVCTFTLCSVQDPAAALAEARRVLKPGGRLLFCEHGQAPDADVAKWQRRIEPVWKHIAGGCHLTRPVASAIGEAGFKLDRVESMYLPGTPRWAGWNEWGVATPA
ncbi:MAG TPA: class I SAM-dependent methyltransferase [Caulobacteraceae bacterium]|nr:class I SAM-dependent methyltransferase [Caulobacteraceae bacterium]